MNNLDEIIKNSEKELEEEYKKIDKICEFNSNKVLNAFKKIRFLKHIFRKQLVMDMVI